MRLIRGGQSCHLVKHLVHGVQARFSILENMT